ncbi:MAG: carboxypeptidase-like regulatory domain-containing protein, partial [Bacteroidia bacterium]|nr:carboxypeptidase-like regulatory domain-containing protein [Bacteroidia bacterium]
MKKTGRQISLTAFCILLTVLSFSQNPPAGKAGKSAFVSGKVVDDNENPLPGVSVVILGRQTGITTNDSGYFKLKVPPDKAFAIVFSHTGLKSEQKNFLLNENEEETVTIRMERSDNYLQEVIIKNQRERQEAGLIRLNPKSVLNLPSAVSGVESLIKIF